MPEHSTSSLLFTPCIMGPTGAGKTAAAIALSRAFPAAVVNADSRQVYRNFPLLTAQPSPEEQAACPHLLYGMLETGQKLGAGDYVRMADKTIETLRGQGTTPLLVGGTGLYFKALLEGLAPIPQVPAAVAEQWQERCRIEGSAALHALLQQIDPQYAAKIHSNDRQRITRALEVHDATGQTFSQWHSRPLPPPKYRACKVGIGLPMPELEQRLAKRIDLMLEAGALDEARAALEICPDPDAPGWSGIGCRETYLHLTGKLTLDACRDLWLRNTRAYAKRQNTWFRSDREVRWFAPNDIDGITEYVLSKRAEQF